MAIIVKHEMAIIVNQNCCKRGSTEKMLPRNSSLPYPVSDPQNTVLTSKVVATFFLSLGIILPVAIHNKQVFIYAWLQGYSGLPLAIFLLF